MKIMLSTYAGTLADSSWTNGFVCSLDKQETSRSLASSLSLARFLSFFPSNTNICTHMLMYTQEESHIDATQLTHRKASLNAELASICIASLIQKQFPPIPLPFHSSAACITLSHQYSMHTVASCKILLLNQALFPGAAMITAPSSKNPRGLIPSDTCVFGYLS